MSQPERIFVDWKEPLARATARLLLEGRKDGIVDLGSDMVIVPSAFAGRLVEEELARQAGTLLLPHIVTPQLFIGWHGKGDSSDVASREAMMTAWLEVLSETQRETMQPLFGAGAKGAIPNLAERQRIAELLYALRDRLGESPLGHDFGRTKDLPTNPEPDRWEMLARLESAYRDKLGLKLLKDRNDVRAEQAVANGSAGLSKALSVAGVRRIWLAFATSPQPIAITALSNLASQGFEVRVLIACEGGKADNSQLFDTWGRPEAVVWREQRRTEWPGFRTQVHVTSTEEDGLVKLRSLVERHHRAGSCLSTAGRVSIVPCDRERHPKMISRSLLQCSVSEKTKVKPWPVKTANPLGKSHRDHAIHHALRAWLDLADAPNLRNLRVVLSISDCASNLLKGRGSLLSLNRELDDLTEAIAPQDLLQAAALAETEKLGAAASAIREAATAIAGDTDNPRALGRRLLALSCPRIDQLSDQDAEMADDVISAIEESIDHVGEIPADRSVSATALVRLAIESAGEKAYRRNLDTDAVNLPGWQDAAWDPVPHLIVFGLNDNLMPEAHHAHPFLPQELRKQLKLTSNEHIFAAAAHHFELLRNQRARIDVIVPRFGPDKGGLRPSRLLYLCPVGEEIIRGGEAAATGRDFLLGKQGRLHHLFPAEDEPSSDAPWKIPEALWLDPAAWPERKESVEKLGQTLSPSAIRAFLTSPGDFWLGYVLGMSDKDFDGIEMNAADFGTLIHDALKSFADDTSMSECADENAVLKRVIELLHGLFLSRFGPNASSELRLQLNMAEARLRDFARQQAADVAKGWRIMQTELDLLVPIPLEEGKGKPVTVDEKNPCLKLRFDRLDVLRGADGKAVAWRVLDYKTKANEDNAFESHVVKATGEQSQHAIALLNVGDVQYRWLDLQLPLYHWAICNSDLESLREIDPDKLGIGYWLISQSGESKIELWPDFSRDNGKGGFAGETAKSLVKIAKVITKLSTDGKDVELPFKRNDYSPVGAFGKHPPDTFMRLKNMGTQRQ